MSYPTKGNGNSPKKECAKAKELHQERDLRLLEMNQQALARKKQKNKQTCHQFNNKRECCVLCLAFPMSNKLAMQVRLLFFSHTPNSRSSPLAATRLQMRQFRYILYGSFGLCCSLASFFLICLSYIRRPKIKGNSVPISGRAALTPFPCLILGEVLANHAPVLGKVPLPMAMKPNWTHTFRVLIMALKPHCRPAAWVRCWELRLPFRFGLIGMCVGATTSMWTVVAHGENPRRAICGLYYSYSCSKGQQHTCLYSLCSRQCVQAIVT